MLRFAVSRIADVLGLPLDVAFAGTFGRRPYDRSRIVRIVADAYDRSLIVTLERFPAHWFDQND